MPEELWKVVAKDNYGRDHISDWVQASGLTEQEAKQRAEELNAKELEHADWCYYAYPESYQIYKWEP